MIEHINVINALSEQISALLDLMQMSNDCVDIHSIWTASEMCQTMHNEMMKEISEIEKEWRESVFDKK